MDNVMTNGFCELNENEMMETNGGVLPILPIILFGGIAAEVITYATVCGVADAKATAAQKKADEMQFKYEYAVSTGDWSVWDN